MAQCVAYGFYLHQKVSNMVLGFFPPYVYSAIPWHIMHCLPFKGAVGLHFTRLLPHFTDDEDVDDEIQYNRQNAIHERFGHVNDDFSVARGNVATRLAVEFVVNDQRNVAYHHYRERKKTSTVGSRIEKKGRIHGTRCAWYTFENNWGRTDEPTYGRTGGHNLF